MSLVPKAQTLDTTYFTTLFEEFKNTPTPKIQAFIAMASRRVSFKAFGEATRDATAFLAAHLLSSSGANTGGTGGAVMSEGVGSLSRSYGGVGDSTGPDAELMTTRYGQNFISLRNTFVVSMMVTGPEPTGFKNGVPIYRNTFEQNDEGFGGFLRTNYDEDSG